MPAETDSHPTESDLADSHPSMERLRLYCEGELPDYEEESLEEHIDGCAGCLEVCQRLDALLFGGFTAAGYAESVEAEWRATDPLTLALEAVLRTAGDLREKVTAWLNELEPFREPGNVREFGFAGAVPIAGTEGLPVYLGAGETAARVHARAGDVVQVYIEAPARTPVLLFLPGDESTVQLVPVEAGESLFKIERDGEYRIAVGPYPPTN